MVGFLAFFLHHTNLIDETFSKPLHLRHCAYRLTLSAWVKRSVWSSWLCQLGIGLVCFTHVKPSKSKLKPEKTFEQNNPSILLITIFQSKIPKNSFISSTTLYPHKLIGPIKHQLTTVI